MLRVSRSEGCYNWLDMNERRANICIFLPPDAPRKTISVVMEIDGEHDTRSDDPWEVADAIECHYKRVFSTGKQDVLNAIKWLRDNEPRLRVDWLKYVLKQKESELVSVQREIDFLQGEIADWTEKAAEVVA